MRRRNPEIMDKIETYVNGFVLKNRRSPSVRTIADDLSLARTTVHRYLTFMNEEDRIRYDGKEIVTSVIRKTDTDMVSTPIVGTVSCGKPLLEEENIESYVALPTALFGKGSFFLLKANGESMKDVGISDGDLVVVRKQEEADEGQVVVALLEDGTTTLKRLFLDQDRKCVRLHPENKEFNDIYVTDCRIQGVAVKVLKDIN